MKMNRKVVRSVICVLLALIFVISLMTALIPTNASAASQSEINQLTQQRKELQAKQKEQQKTINSLRSKKASVVDQKAALDKENDLAQQEIELVKEQITAYDQQIEDKGVELEEAKQEEEAQTVRFRGCVRHLEEYGQMSYIAILLEATSLSDLLARMDMVGEVIAYNKQVQADMTAAREKVETVKAELEDARTELQDKQSELETKQVVVKIKAGEGGRTFGSVSSKEIATGCSRRSRRPMRCSPAWNRISTPIRASTISMSSSRRTCSRRSTSRSRSCAARRKRTRTTTPAMIRAKPTAPPAP